MNSKAPIFSVPTGVIWFCSASALPTSVAERPWARSASRIEIDLHLALLAAVGIGNRPRRRPSSSCGRMKFCARSKSCVWESVSLDSANWMIGTLDAL